MISNISRISSFNECRQKAYNWDERRLSPLREAEPLLIGSATHEGIAEFLSKRDRNSALQITEKTYRDRLEGTLILPEERAGIEHNIELSKRMVGSFCSRYNDADMQVVWPEVSFCVPLPNTLHHCKWFHQVLHPDIPFDKCPTLYKTADASKDDRCWQPHYFTGKTDAVIQWRGAMWLLEHKTTSYTGDIFYNRFHLDFQPTGYLYGIGKALGTTPHGFILNVLKKPTKNNRDQLAVSFESEAYLRSEEDLQRFEREFILQVQDYEDAFLRNRIYMNTKSCTAWNRKCQYHQMCLNQQDYPDQYAVREPDYVEKRYYEILGLPVPETKPELINIEEV